MGIKSGFIHFLKITRRADVFFALFSLATLVAVPRLHRAGQFGDEFGLGQPEMYAMETAPAEESPPETVPVNVLTFRPYVVVKGDTISEIAHRLNLNQDSIISCNDIEKARGLQIGTVLRIPNMNGIMHTIKPKETVDKLSEMYKVPAEQILEVNNITEIAHTAGEMIFIPEAKLPSIELRRIWGELFRYPSRGWISSPFGYRADPFTGKRRFHNGIDIAGAHGAPVVAAMDGTVLETGYNASSGNYIVIGHVGGYTSFYAHLDKIHVDRGARVAEGRRIGDVGNTGYSTGSHLHFTIFRWGKPVNPVLLLH
jgi:murein DD-endopeptidase MepM/ murein hydrolase activator NlpD